MNLETFAHSHILGGLYGQALGDAWAMPAYMRPDQTWDYYGGWITTLVAAPPDHPVHAGFLAGQVTDDTQQAMALAQVLIRDGRITVPAAAEAIINWYDQINGDTSPFVGPSTRRAVQALKAGGNPHHTGAHGDTNGGAMRISPIGLIHPGNPEAAVEDAVIACTPTHFTDVALAGACAVAAAVARAMTPDTTLEQIIDVAVWGADRGATYGMPWMGASVARKIDFAVQLATDNHLSERDRLRNLYDYVGATLAVPDSIPCAFGILAMANGNPVQAATYAAALSGDADTVAAIACAIAGAWQGIDAIPLDVIQTIRQANPQYNFEEIAEGLYDVALKHPRPEATPGAETLEEILGQE